MTIEKLLELPACELEQMSDAQMMEIFNVHLPITRPDRATAIHKDSGPKESKNTQSNELKKKLVNMDPAKQQLLQDLFKASGVDMKSILGGKK